MNCSFVSAGNACSSERFVRWLGFFFFFLWACCWQLSSDCLLLDLRSWLLCNFVFRGYFEWGASGPDKPTWGGWHCFIANKFPRKKVSGLILRFYLCLTIFLLIYILGITQVPYSGSSCEFAEQSTMVYWWKALPELKYIQTCSTKLVLQRPKYGIDHFGIEYLTVLKFIFKCLFTLTKEAFFNHCWINKLSVTACSNYCSSGFILIYCVKHSAYQIGSVMVSYWLTGAIAACSNLIIRHG